MQYSQAKEIITKAALGTTSKTDMDPIKTEGLTLTQEETNDLINLTCNLAEALNEIRLQLAQTKATNTTTIINNTINQEIQELYNQQARLTIANILNK